ncbi:MAG: hypothetical protein MNPFHGCM_00173 [Gemmatimonadaceae bacterium]|nr:hypothetical protein [Gemmatimonadaceae bacterium]
MSALFLLALLVGTIGWIALPLLPAVRELLRPTDAGPLTQVGQDSGDLAIFAEGFRRYLSSEMSLPADSGQATYGQLRDGTPHLELAGDAMALRQATAADGTVGCVVTSARAIELPGGETFLYEVCVRDRFTGGADAAYRALLTERDAQLGPRSRVLRWLHVEGDVVVGEGSDLMGRASSSGTMRLGEGVRFTRLRAARILAGSGEPDEPQVPPPVIQNTVKLPRTARQLRAFVRVDGDLVIAAGATFPGTLVVRGHVRIGDGARIGGSIKAHGDCVLGASAVVNGSVVARGDVHLGASSRVGAPVIAEGRATVGEGAAIGNAMGPASLVADAAVLHRGAQIFGCVSARLGGETVT